MDRRDFMKLGLKAVIVMGGLSTVSSSLARNAYWGFVVDLTKCIGCGKCVQACRAENNVPEGEYRTWVERYLVKNNGDVVVESPKMGEEGYAINPPDVDLSEVKTGFFVPKLCNQCDNPPCVYVCPVNATHLTSDGVVIIDWEKCIGCGYCVQACPYGARYLYPDDYPVKKLRGLADKCNWCYHRIQRGLEPACVHVCPTKARVFGNLRDPNSAVRQYLKHVEVERLRPELNTGSKVYYYFGSIL
jgi:Fe-S-cluster-containing dehydrogenase component